MSIDGASAQPIDASVYAASPVSSTGRRPHRSDSGPHTSCEVPNASSKVMSVNCACDTDAPKLSVSAGSDGRYRSVVIGWMPSSSDSTTTTTAGVMAGVRMAGTVCGAAGMRTGG